MESLAKLKPAFKKDGSTTAGNSSQISDGAAAVVLARRSTAQKLGMPILAKFVDYAVKGCPPSIMGIGPAIAIPELLKKTGKRRLIQVRPQKILIFGKSMKLLPVRLPTVLRSWGQI